MQDDKLDLILETVTEIRTALWPDKGQPGVLTQHATRLKELETWQSRIKGGGVVFGFLWSLLAALLGIHVSKH